MPEPDKSIQSNVQPSQAAMLLHTLHLLSTADSDRAVLNGLLQPLHDVEAMCVSLFFVNLDYAGQPESVDLVACWQKNDGQPEVGILNLSESPVAKLWLSSPDQPLLVTNVTDKKQVDPEAAKYYVEREWISTAVIPLNGNGVWSAGLVCSWSKPHSFSEDEVALYNTLMAVTGPVVENYHRIKTVEQQRDLLQLMIDTLADTAIYAKDTRSKFLAGNITMARWMGAESLAEIFGKDDFAFYPEEIASKYSTEEQALLASDRPIIDEENLYTNVDGQQLWLLTSKFPVHDDEGNVVGLVGTGRDVTARKEAQIILDNERNLMQILIDSIPDQIYIKDTESRFTRINRAQADFLGVESPEEAIGKTDLDFLPKNIAPELLAEEREMLSTGIPVIDRLEQHDLGNGLTRWVVSSKVPVADSNGNMIGLAGISRDISDIKTAEETERRQIAVIEAQKQVLRELSTPIIPIMDRILVMPLIGSIDTTRARDIMRAMLSGISDYRAKTVILDITGVPVVDSGVAEHLNKTIQAARLKGTHTIVTGISDAVAETIVDLGIDWTHIETLRDLQSGLLVALRKLGIRLERQSDRGEFDD